MKLSLPPSLRQPTTIHGIAGLVAIAAGFTAWFAFGFHDMTVVLGVSVAAWSGVCMLIDDNTAEPSSVEKLLTDAVTAVAQRHLALALPGLINDGLQVFRDLVPAPAPAPLAAPTPESAAGGAGGPGAGGAVAALLGLLLLCSVSACAPQVPSPATAAQPVIVGWAQVVQYAKYANAALDGLGAQLAASPDLTPVQQAEIKRALNGLDALTRSLDGAATPDDPKTIAAAVLNGIDAVVQALPIIPLPVQIAVGVATPILTAFVNDLPTVVPATAAP